jgi:tRNA(adenine34) deaminase
MSTGVPLADQRYMRACLDLAHRARDSGDAAVGSVVVRGDEILAEGIEAVRARGDVTAHAELEALRAACARLSSLDLSGCTLYTSVDPCVMCAYAIRLARISVVVAGTAPLSAPDVLDGWTVLTDARILPARPLPLIVRNVLADECRAVLGAPSAKP